MHGPDPLVVLRFCLAPTMQLMELEIGQQYGSIRQCTVIMPFCILPISNMTLVDRWIVIEEKPRSSILVVYRKFLAAPASDHLEGLRLGKHDRSLSVPRPEV